MTENANVDDSEDQDVNNDEITDDNTDVTDDEVDPSEAAIEAAVAARLVALQEQARAEAKREVEERVEAERRAAEEASQFAELQNTFGSTIRELRANLGGIKVATDTGDERALTDDEFERFIAQPLQRYNQKGEQAASVKVLSALAQAALSTLPETMRPEFDKRARNKPLDQWLSEFAEIKAEQTSWAKKQKADMEAAVRAAEARGFKRGQGSQAAPPTQNKDSSKPNATVDRSTLSGAAKALAQGLITDAEYREIHNKIVNR